MTPQTKPKTATLPQVAATVLVAFTLPAQAAIVPLSLVGKVDISGATLGGVSAPVGSEFQLDLGIDDSMAASGSYTVTSIGYTLTLGTYTTVAAWAITLKAVGSGAGMTLESVPWFAAPDEQFHLSLTNFDAGALFSDPATWASAGSSLTGDLVVRGVGGFSSDSQLSGVQPYTGTLALKVSEPSVLALVGLGLAGLTLRRRRG